MTTKLEEIIESLNLKLQRGIINKDDIKVLRRLAIQCEDYINKIEKIRLFITGLVTLRKIGYDEKDIFTILNWILNLGIGKVDRVLFEVSIYINQKYSKEFEKYLKKEIGIHKKYNKPFPNIDNILDKIKIFSDSNIKIKNSIENIKKCNMPPLNYIYDKIQNSQDDYNIEEIENIKSKISCTLKNLVYIKYNLENIKRDPRYDKNLKDISNIKRELHTYFDELLNILGLLDIYKQFYIEFKKEYLPRLLFEGLHYIKEYGNININKSNINKNYEQNILYIKNLLF
jgi:hypothetical protein